MITGKSGSFFESKVRLERVTEDGASAKFNELYVVDAVSFTECEAKVTQFVGDTCAGEFEVLTEVRAKYGEIFFSDNEGEDVFYKVRVDFLSIDESSGKTKHSKTDYLVQGSSIESAKANIDEALGDSQMDYKIVSVIETVVVDVIG